MPPRRIVGRKIVDTNTSLKRPIPIPVQERAWLVEFEYEHYCQGFNWVRTHVLVYAPTFHEACSKILKRSQSISDTYYYHARDFEDKTLL